MRREIIAQGSFHGSLSGTAQYFIWGTGETTVSTAGLQTEIWTRYPPKKYKGQRSLISPSAKVKNEGAHITYNCVLKELNILFRKFSNFAKESYM
jgi:hypothetical protein